MPDFFSPQFWSAVAQIILIDLILSGDNAVVIALACRNLAPEQRRYGIFWGVAGAVALRVLLTAFAAALMEWAWIKLLGGLLLLWIGIKLLLPEEEHEQGIPGAGSVAGAVKTIIVADFVMSLDNVVGVAGASHGNLWLLVFGLIVSIPIIVFASQLIMKTMERLPFIVTLGAALLGWVAGGMINSDHGLQPWFAQLPWLHRWVLPAAGAVLVVVLGSARARRKRGAAYRRVGE
ncbi:MAG: TerC family protein [Betaproteobacteria bacterium]|nr:TerC family protein [Betaproteobacteria bacterium]